MNIKNLNMLSKNLKKKIIDISFQKKTHHIGSCLSSLDILLILFFSFMTYQKANRSKNDFFILSKGHAALVYYLILSEKKFFSKEYLLQNFIADGGTLGGHPDLNNDLGINYCSGSLGHGISVGCGVALSYLKDKKKNKVIVLMGDGECNEGSVWESFLFASHQNLQNLFVIIDYNNLQGLGTTKDILNLFSLKKKIQSFNWNVLEVDGHDLNEINSSLKKLNIFKNKPNCLIAKTTKGKGLSFMENKLDSHYLVLDEEEYQKSLIEIKNINIL